MKGNGAALSITWLGHATFILQTPGGKRIVTDPWLEGNPACPADRKRIDKADVILLSHGGPLSSMADAELANLRTGAAGFVAASSVERIPIEQALKDACRGVHSTDIYNAVLHNCVRTPTELDTYLQAPH